MIEQATTKRRNFSYDEAWLYVATCTHKKKYDWRMPTMLEHFGRKYQPLIIGQWYERDYFEHRTYVTPVRTKDD
jgi:hypothetical protein